MASPTRSPSFTKFFQTCSLYLFIYCFLGPHLQHIEVPRPGVNSELQLPTYTTVTAVPDLSCMCKPHHSSWQRRILNPLSKARGRTCILMDTSRVHNLLRHKRNALPSSFFSFFFFFWPPRGICISWTRDQIRAIVMTYTAVAATLDP